MSAYRKELNVTRIENGDSERSSNGNTGFDGGDAPCPVPAQHHQDSDPVSPPSPVLSLSRVHGHMNVLYVFYTRPVRVLATLAACHQPGVHSLPRFRSVSFGERLLLSPLTRAAGHLCAALLFTCFLCPRYLLPLLCPGVSPSMFCQHQDSASDTPFHYRVLSWKKTARFVVEFLLLNY